MTDPLRKKIPLLALIFLVLMIVYTTRYRTITGFNNASLPADVQIQNHISKIITPLVQVFQNIFPAMNDSLNLYNNSPPPPIFRPITENLYSSYNTIVISLNKLNTPSITSTNNMVYILPLLFREVATTIKNTVDTIIQNPALLSERSLTAPLPSYKTPSRNTLFR